MLLRDEPRGGEPFTVLMLERHGSIAFPGAHAFPGGLVEPGDSTVAGAELPVRQRWAAPGEGDRPPEALVYWVAAVRELFEEVGILLAVPREGGVGAPEAAARARLRARCGAGEAFGAVLASAGLLPATHTLGYFARWITPVANPRRWDTRFLVGRVPPGQEPAADGTETVSCRWLGPRAALAAYEAGTIALIPPTVRTLDDLARFPSVTAVLEDAARRVVRAVTPELVHDGARTAIRYPDNTGARDVPPRDLVLREGRWRPERE